METSHIVLDLQLRCEGAPDHLAWCATSNLIAAACISRTPGVQPVCVLDPDCPQEHVILDVPLVDEGDKIISLMWSPIECPRVLLTTTSMGNCYVWSQSNGIDPLAINVWHGSKVESLGKLVACAKWMTAAPAWVWKPVESRAWPSHAGGNWKSGPTNALDGQFFEHRNVVDGNFPWLRPGKLFIGLVTVDGDFLVMQRAFGSLSSRWVQLQRLSTGISGKIQAADIVGYRGRRIRVAASSASLPGKLYIMETEGDATWKTDKGVFKIKTIGEVGFTGDCTIESVTLEPCCGGKKLYLCVRAHGLDEVALRGYKQSDDHLTWEESGTWIRCAPNIDDVHVQDWVRFVTSPDGTWSAALSSRDLPTLLHTTNLSLVEELRTTGGVKQGSGCGSASCTAFSPCGTALAVGSESVSNKCSRILIWVLGDRCSENTWAATNADRVLWGFATKRHLWDVLQRVRVSDLRRGGFRSQKSTLNRLDDVIHAQPYHPRPTYAAMLDHVKARLLSYWDDGLSKAILIDIYSRSTVIFIYNTLSYQPSSKGEASASESQDAADERQWVAWSWWLHRFTHFCGQCLRTWTTRCRSQDGVADKGESPSNVPFIRLLLDSYFIQRLITLVYSLPGLVKAHMTTDLQRDLYAFYLLAKKLHEIVKKQDGSKRDDPNAPLAAVKAVKASMGGSFNLHYYRPEGVLDWQEVRKLEAIAGFTQLKDEEIEASAGKLGLLPASAPPPHRSPLEDLGKGYSKFRRPTSSTSATFEQAKGMLGLKRKRWQLERDISIGLLPAKWPSAVKRHHEDCLSGTALSRNETPSHCSVDGASMTSQLTPPVLQGKEQSVVKWAMAKASMVAAPISKSRWKRMRQ